MLNIYEYTVHIDSDVVIEGLVWASSYDEAIKLTTDTYFDQDPELVYVNPKQFEPKVPTIVQTNIHIKY